MLIGWRVPDVVAANPLDIPHDTSSFFVSDAKLILDPGGAIDRARTDLEAEYDIPGSILGRLRDQTVAYRNQWENMVAWAFGGFTRDPEPVLQQYSAYEASLDNLDASFLRSGAAPTRMLVQPTKVYLSELLRDPFFGAPSTMVARACHYVQTDFTSRWELLVRVPDRCGQLMHIKTVTATFGQTAPVPSAPSGSAVVRDLFRRRVVACISLGGFCPKGARDRNADTIRELPFHRCHRRRPTYPALAKPPWGMRLSTRHPQSAPLRCTKTI